VQLTVERKPEKRSGGATRFHRLNGASARGEYTNASRPVLETAGERFTKDSTPFGRRVFAAHKMLERTRN
jgi:hypothetical protein